LLAHPRFPAGRDGLDHTAVPRRIDSAVRPAAADRRALHRQVIAGNTRLKAAQQLGMAKVPVSGG
jgi:hypothetical protein